MTTILYDDPELVIALNRKAIFFYPEDLQIFKEVELPEDLEKCGFDLTRNDAKSPDDGVGNGEPQLKEQTASAPKESPIIQNVCLSPDRQYFAITTSGQKAVLLYWCRPEHAKLVSVRPLARASSALCFSSDSKSLLVVDKTGDCYQYDCIELNAAPRLLLGHLAIVFDVQWTPDQKFIITADRDDKIRVTKYPETYDIHGYCLGHKEFVSDLCLLEDGVLISVSGDKSIRLWNYESCKQLACAELPAPGLRITMRKLGNHQYQVAVLLYQPEECVAIYEIKRTDADWKINENQLLSFPSVAVGNLCFAKDRLFIAGTVDDRFVFKLAPINGTRPSPEHWVEMVEEQFKMDMWKMEDVSMWFKKRYDNVAEYMERKKRRIEKKSTAV